MESGFWACFESESFFFLSLFSLSPCCLYSYVNTDSNCSSNCSTTSKVLQKPTPPPAQQKNKYEQNYSCLAYYWQAYRHVLKEEEIIYWNHEVLVLMSVLAETTFTEPLLIAFNPIRKRAQKSPQALCYPQLTSWQRPSSLLEEPHWLWTK